MPATTSCRPSEAGPAETVAAPVDTVGRTGERRTERHEARSGSEGAGGGCRVCKATVGAVSSVARLGPGKAAGKGDGRSTR